MAVFPTLQKGQKGEGKLRVTDIEQEERILVLDTEAREFHEISGWKEAVIELTHEISGLKEETNRLKERGSKQTHEISGLKEEISRLKEEISRLKESGSKQTHEISGLKEEISRLKEEIRRLKESGSKQTHEISRLKESGSKQTHEISRLKVLRLEDDSQEAAEEIIRGLQDINRNLQLEKNLMLENLEVCFEDMRSGHNGFWHLILDTDAKFVKAGRKRYSPQSLS